VLGNSSCSMSTENEEADLVNQVLDADLEAEETTYRHQQEAGKCMVCGIALGRRDDVVWCRRCGRLAHRIHLMEWIATKKVCPACGARLDERYYR
jgi:ribosomal protein L37E